MSEAVDYFGNIIKEADEERKSDPPRDSQKLINNNSLR
jgi:hypothetical protein